MRFVVALALVVGCGRVGFDDVAVTGNQCQDGLDNDFDSAIDEDDPGCAASDATRESSGTVPEDCEHEVIDIERSGMFTGDTSDADNADSGSCGGGQTGERAFRLTLDAPVEGYVFVTDDPESEFDTLIYARDDCAAPSTELACDREAGMETLSRIRGEALGAGSVFLFVDGQGAGQEGVFHSRIELLVGEGGACHPEIDLFRCSPELSCEANPSGDDTCQPASCVVAEAHTDSFTATGTTASARNVHAASCGEGSDGGLRAPEAVFQMTLTAPAGDVVITTDHPGTNYDSLIYVRDACFGNEIACDDDGGANRTSQLRTGPLPAGDYFVFVDGFGLRRGDFELSATVTP